MATAKTETLKATEIDALTGETVVRDLTDNELTQRKIDATNAAAQKTLDEAKATARASALAKLAALGLTADEIASL